MGTLLITGANRGIGLALTRAYLEDGWRVHATCRSPGSALALQALVGDHSDRARVHSLSVTDWEGIRDLARELDGEPLDLLINNAGVRRMDAYYLGEIGVQAFMDSMEVNALGPLKVSEAFRPHLARGTDPLLVIIGSSLGSITKNRDGGDYAYRASKAAVNAVMRSLAMDLKEEGITVISLHPGWVRTDMGGQGASLSPEESATAIRNILKGVTPGDTGRFLRFDGHEDPF